MKNSCLAFIFLFMLQGCGPTASIVGSTITLAQTGSTSRTIVTSGSSLFIKEQTGKQPLEHVADNTINAEVRKCEVSHSAEINQIFFTTLDEFDCEKNYLNQDNLYYLR